MKKLNKIISTLLALIITFSILPLSAFKVEALTTPALVDSIEASKKIDELYEMFKKTPYFTTMGTQTCRPEGREASHGCENCQIENIIKQAWFKNKFGTLEMKQFPKTYQNNGSYFYSEMKSCAAFAAFAEWYIYKTNNSDKVTTRYVGTYNYNYSNVSKHVEIGDLIRLSNSHSAIVISYDSTGVKVLDSNWGEPNKYNCKVSIHTIKYSSYSKIAISRAENASNHLNVVDCDKTVKTICDTTLRKFPYDKTEIIEYITMGTNLKIVGSYVNIYGNTWYKTDSGSWIYSGKVTEPSSNIVTYKPTKSTNKKTSKDNIVLPKPAVVVEDQDYTIPAEIPVRDGYKFMGYALTEDAKVAKFQAGQKISADDMRELIKDDGGLSLYPVWRKTKTDMHIDKYDINLNASDSSNLSTTVTVKCTGDLKNVHLNMKYTIDNTSVVSVKSTDASYENFIMWDQLTNKFEIKAKAPGTANVKIELYDLSNKLLISKSIFVKVDASYNISYYDDTNGKITKTQTKQFNKDIELLEYIPEKEDNVFMGWTTTVGSSTVEYGPGDKFVGNNDLILYPVWNEKYEIKTPVIKNGVLTISGKCDMASYPTGKTPWAEHSNEITEIVIKSGVTSIGANAFANFKNLTKVSLPASLTKIGAKAFYNCEKLQTIAIPASVVSIGNRAFANCKALQVATMPTDTTRSVPGSTIGAFAFENCVSLASVEIPDTVTEIGTGAFTGCSAMDIFEIPAGVEVINDSTFFGCSSLEEINIPSGVTEIGDGAFNGCSAAETIVIPDTVNSIGDQAFSGCSVLTEIDIPESVDTIGAGVFTNCSALNDVDLPNNMEYIGEGMFSGCSALETVEIPDSVSYIGDGAFGYCSSLTGVDIPENVTEINNSTFYGCSSLTEFEIPGNIISIGDYAFGDCNNLKNVTISEGTASIGIGAFAFCDSLETVSMPASLSVIDDGAFMECASLTDIDLLESELTIGEDAFLGCSSLTDIQLPEGIVSIDEGAFDGCSADFVPTCFSTSSVYGQLSDTYDNLDVIYPVSGVTLDKSEVNLLVGQTLNLNATVAPYNATCKDIIWRSNNPDCVSVDENGKVTALTGGRATIIATTKDNTFVASCVINSTVPVEGVSLDYNEIDAFTDEEFSLNYTFAPANPTNIDVTWSSSDENVATVSEDGTVKILSEGKVTITVTTNDGSFTDSCVIDAIEYVESTGITIDSSLELVVGESKQLYAQISPTNATSKEVFWYVDNIEIVEVSEDGMVTALKEGTTTIYAYAGLEEDAPYAVCTVTVKSSTPEYNYTFSIQSPSRTEIRHKDGIKLHAKVEGTAPTGSCVVWTASNGKFKTEEINGGNSLKIVSDSNGKTTFTATLYSADGEILATDSIEMKSKAGFFDKIGSFFRSLFGGTKIYEN